MAGRNLFADTVQESDTAPVEAARGRNLFADETPQSQPEGRTWGEAATDAALSLGAQGSMNVAKAGIGLADMVSQGLGNAVEAVTQGMDNADFSRDRTVTGLLKQGGVDFGESNRVAQDLKSRNLQAQYANQEQAWNQGIGEGISNLVSSPALAADIMLQQLPQMGFLVGAARAKAAEVFAGAGGGAAGAAAVKAALPELAKFSAKLEAAQTAGQQAQEYADQGDGLSAGETAASLGSGLGTYVGGRVANKIIPDVEAAIAASKYGATTMKDVVKNFLKSSGSEGLEEGLQSPLELVATNINEGKPITQGMGRAAAEGSLLGAAMGGGVSLTSSGANMLSGDVPVSGEQPQAKIFLTPDGNLDESKYKTREEYLAARSELEKINDTSTPVEQQPDTASPEQSQGVQIPESQQEGAEATDQPAQEFDQETQDRISKVERDARVESLNDSLKTAKKNETAAEKNLRELLKKPDSSPDLVAKAKSDLASSISARKQAELDVNAFGLENQMTKEDMLNLMDNPSYKVEQGNLDEINLDETPVPPEEIDVGAAPMPTERTQRISPTDKAPFPPAIARVNNAPVGPEVSQAITEDATGVSRRDDQPEKTMSEDRTQAVDMSNTPPENKKFNVEDYMNVPGIDYTYVNEHPYEFEQYLKQRPYLQRNLDERVKRARERIKNNPAAPEEDYAPAYDLGEFSNSKDVWDETGLNLKSKADNKIERSQYWGMPERIAYYIQNNPNAGKHDVIVFDDVVMFKQKDGSYADDPDADPDFTDMKFDSIFAIRNAAKEADIKLDDVTMSGKSNLVRKARDLLKSGQSNEIALKSKAVDATSSPMYKKRTADEVGVISKDKADEALKTDKVAQKILAKGNQLKEGDLVGARLNINVLNKTGVPVQSIHAGGEGIRSKMDAPRNESGFYKGEVLTYKPIATLKNVYFTVKQKAREGIAAGTQNKEPMASADGRWHETDSPSFDGVLARFNPHGEHLFIDQNGRAVKYADEATIHGHRAYLRGRIEYYTDDDIPVKAGPSKSNARAYDESMSPEEELVFMSKNAGGQSVNSADTVRKWINNKVPSISRHVIVVPSHRSVLGASPDSNGMYYKGKTYLFADKINDADDAARIALHEVVGHKGVIALLGDKANKVYSGILTSKDPEVQKAVQDIATKYAPELAAQKNQTDRDAVHALEVLAKFAESKKKNPTVIDWAMARIKKILGYLKGNGDYSLYDLNALLEDSHRYMMNNSGGKMSGMKPKRLKVAAKSKVSQTDTPAFKRWFGNSKVVDKDGKPLVVYHGTNKDFSSFKDSGNIFFTSDPDHAAFFAGGIPTDGNMRGKSPNIIPVYLSISNPLVVDGSKTRTKNPVVLVAELKNKALKNGNDGIIIRNFRDANAGVADTYIAFKPTQIKSAIGNSGEFNSDNSNILKSKPDTDQLKSNIKQSLSRSVNSNKSKLIKKRMKSTAKRWLTKEGLLTAEDYKAKEEMEGYMREANKVYGPVMSKRLNKAVSEEYGKRLDSSWAIQADVLDALQGKPAKLKPKTAAVVGEMRTVLDYYSNEIQKTLKDLVNYQTDGFNADQADVFSQYLKNQITAQEAVDANKGVSEAVRLTEMIRTIEENKGSYLNVSYRASHDPKWFDEVWGDGDNGNYGRPDLVLPAIKELMQDKVMPNGKVKKGMSLEEARNVVYQLLAKHEDIANPNDFMGHVGAMKKLGILKQKQKITPAFEKLLGKYENPLYSFNASLSKMANIVGAHHFLKSARDNGLKAGILSRTQKVGYVPVGETESLAPLSGLYVQKDYKQAIEDIVAKTPMTEVMKTVLTVVGAIKAGKTVYSYSTSILNFISNWDSAMQNGHFLKGLKDGYYAKAFKDITDFAIKGEGVDNMRKMARLGIFDETAFSSEVSELLQQMNSGKEPGKESKAKRFWNVSKGAIEGMYQYGDLVWKMAGYQIEYDQAINDGMTPAEAEKYAAGEIRDTYPTYSNVAKVVQYLKRNPLIGDFPSFTWEVYRTRINQVKRINRDIQTGNKKAAIKRATNLLASMALPSIAAYIWNLKEGLDDDDTDEIKKNFLPPWQRNSTMAFYRDDKGNLVGLDLGRAATSDAIVKVIRSLLNDQDSFGEKSYNALKEAIAPLLSIEFTAQSVFNLMQGEDQYGKPLWGNTTPGGDIAMRSLNALTGALAPTVLSKNIPNIYRANAESINKFADAAGLPMLGTVGSTQYRDYKTMDEILPVRSSRIPVAKMLEGKVWQQQEDEKIAAATATNPLMVPLKQLEASPEKISNKMYEKAARDFLEAHDRSWKPVLDAIGAAKDNDLMTTNEIRDTLKSANVSDKDITRLLKGEIPQYRVPKDFNKRLREKIGDVDNASRYARERARIKKQATRERRFANEDD